MLKFITRGIVILTYVLISCHVFAQRSFVSVKGHQFYKDLKPYSYIGANYWYGGLLSVVKGEAGKARLQQELDFLRPKANRVAIPIVFRMPHIPNKENTMKKFLQV
jgi:mannan endo-1,4-beta-mannosidase